MVEIKITYLKTSIGNYKLSQNKDGIPTWALESSNNLIIDSDRIKELSAILEVLNKHVPVILNISD